MESPFFPPVRPAKEAPNKRARKTITTEVQKNVWNTHIGTGIKEIACPLCGHNVIKCPTSRCGLECAHIVADRFFTGEPSPLSLYPSCGSCNNSCRESCILDFLFQAGRYKQLENLIRSVHGQFSILNSDLPPERLLMHEVIDHLYGFERYKAGGGIYNDVEIYTFARSVHMKQLNEQMKELSRQIDAKSDEMRLLSVTIPKRKRPPSVI